jgi:hypothetical protein
MICLIKTGVASAASLELSPIRVEMIKLIGMQGKHHAGTVGNFI